MSKLFLWGENEEKHVKKKKKTLKNFLTFSFYREKYGVYWISCCSRW